MKKIKIFLIVLCSVFFVSCESNTYSEISAKTEVPTYVANIKPIITANCIVCHNGIVQTPSLETYLGVKNACLNNNLICRIDSENCGERMPQGGKLPQPDIDLIKLWAANGFIEQ